MGDYKITQILVSYLTYKMEIPTQFFIFLR